MCLIPFYKQRTQRHFVEAELGFLPNNFCDSYYQVFANDANVDNIFACIEHAGMCDVLYFIIEDKLVN